MADLTGKMVAILVDNYFEEIEMTSPRKALEEAGATVHLVATKDQAVFGMNHAEMGDEFDADVTIEEMKSSDYEALVVPGGTINGDHLRVSQKAQSWIRDFNDAGKPIALICHAPWLLINAGLIKGRRVTSYPTLQEDLMNAGAAEWSDEEVVIDGNLITSRNPDDLPAFNNAIIEKLGKKGS